MNSIKLTQLKVMRSIAMTQFVKKNIFYEQLKMIKGYSYNRGLFSSTLINKKNHILLIH